MQVLARKLIPLLISFTMIPICYAQTVFLDGFEDFLTLSPAYYDKALRNPMKGFTADAEHEWATLDHKYFRWNELENDESDGLDKILQVTHQEFTSGPANNVKYIPRVYLHWNADDEKYWPADMQEDDYSSAQFQSRVTRLIERLGVAWNNDPRVAFVELGIFGKWGEHHSPDPTAAMQALTGQAFRDAFPNKKVSVRHVWSEFQGNGFGEYWDSWGHYQQMWGHGGPIADVNQTDETYLSNYIGGEVAYNWGDSEIQPGSNPTDSVSDPFHRDFLIQSIRWLHGTQLRWIADYDDTNPVAQQGAEQLQRVMGYRFVLDSVGFKPEIHDGKLQLNLSVINEGSAPFYYDWPVEAALHDPVTRTVVWKDTFTNLDIRDWAPGKDWTAPQWEEISNWPNMAVKDGWSDEPLQWGTPPQIHKAGTSFTIDLPTGVYVLTLAILDPAGMQPSLRFATSQYWNGGRHPIGLISIGQPGGGPLPAELPLDDPGSDNSLFYDF